jgi:uncharacterized membrane protein YgcG
LNYLDLPIRQLAIRRASVSGAFLLEAISRSPDVLRRDLLLTRLQAHRLLVELRRMELQSGDSHAAPCNDPSSSCSFSSPFSTPDSRENHTTRRRLLRLNGVLLLPEDPPPPSPLESPPQPAPGAWSLSPLPAAPSSPGEGSWARGRLVLRDPGEFAARGEEAARVAGQIEGRLADEARRRLEAAAAALAAAGRRRPPPDGGSSDGDSGSDSSLSPARWGRKRGGAPVAVGGGGGGSSCGGASAGSFSAGPQGGDGPVR